MCLMGLQQPVAATALFMALPGSGQCLLDLKPPGRGRHVRNPRVSGIPVSPACLRSPGTVASRVECTGDYCHKVQSVPSPQQKSPSQGRLRNQEEGTPETELGGTSRVYGPQCSVQMREPGLTTVT